MQTGAPLLGILKLKTDYGRGDIHIQIIILHSLRECWAVQFCLKYCIKQEEIITPQCWQTDVMEWH